MEVEVCGTSVAVVVVALLVVDVDAAPLEVVAPLAARVVEVDDADGDDVLEQAALVNARAAVATASTARPVRRPFPTPAA